MQRLAVLSAFGVVLSPALLAMAAPVTLQNFNSPGAQQSDPTLPFSLDAKFGSWGAPFATLTAEPDDFKIRSHDYGSGYKYLGAEIDGGNNDMLQVNFTVSEGTAGCIVDITDNMNNGIKFPFYGLTPGNGTNRTNDYTFTVALSSGLYFTGSGVLDVHHISQMNIEIDPGPTSAFYTASFNDVSLVQAPEPVGLAAVGVAALAFSGRRRREQM